MKSILTERKYRLPLGSNASRRRYLEKIAAQINNELTDPALTPADRSRFYNTLLATVKEIHSMDCDAKLEDLEKRLEKIEKENNP